MKNNILNILLFLVVLFSLSNKLDAQCEFTISPNNTFNSCLQAEENVVWKNPSANLIVTNNTLTKSGSNGWNAGAESTAKVQNYGYVATIVNETNTNRMFGLSNSNTNNNFNTIEYAIYLRSNGNIGIYESGSNIGNFGTYSSGDTAKIAIKDGVVFYYINSNLVYTSSIAPSLPLLVDVSLHTNGSTLENVIISNGTDGSFISSATSVGVGPTYQWKLNGLNVGTNSPVYTNPSITDNDTIICELTPGTGGCGAGPFNSNSIFVRQINLTNNSSVSISTTPVNSKCDKAITEGTFVNMGSNMIANNNNLVKIGANGWDGGAVSFQSINDNGEAYTIINETNTNRVFGLTNTGAENSNQSTIDYGIYLVNNGTIRIYETGTNLGNFGTYSSGDTIRVVAEDGNIYYYINSNLLYTSAVAPVFPLYVDVSINTTGGTLEDIHLISGTAGDFNADVINGGSAPSYQWKLNGLDVGANSATYSNPSLSINDIITCEVTPDAVGCTPSTVLSNVILFNQINPAANASVSISTSPTASKCDKALTVAAFTNIGSNMSANGNNLIKNGPNGWDGGAVSFQSIDDNGEAYTIINETNTNRMFGLTNSGAENPSYTTIDYAMYLRNNGIIRIYEAGTNRGDFGGYSSGDTARVVAEDGNIYYYINSNLLYISAIAPVFPLYIDVCINTGGATLENVHLISGTAGDFTADVINGGSAPSYQWKLNGLDVGANSATYSNPSLNVDDVVTCEVIPDAAGCTVSPIASNTITFNQLNPTANSSVSISTSPTASKCDKALTVAAFTNMGSNMIATGNDLVKNGPNGWDGGAVSFQSIDDNGEVYTIINETNTTRVLGLTNLGASATSYTSIDFAIYLRSNGEIRIYESGTYRGIFGSYASGDTARVIAEDGNILYYINSNLLYTSAVAPVFPLYVDVSIFNDGGTLEDIHLISGTDGNFTADVINVGTSPSYQWKLNGANVGANSASYVNPALNINDVVTCNVTPDAAGCIISPIASNTITFNQLNPTANSSVSISSSPTASKCDKTLTVATFNSMGSNMIATGNNLVKNGPNGWDGGAVSFQSINDNGEVYTIINEINTNRMFGLTNAGAENSNFTTIDYAIYLRNNGVIRIYEAGSNRGDFGGYSSGDTARVVAEDGNIYYYINSNLLYTSANIPVFPLYVDVCINTDGATLENIHLISGTTGNFNANAINAGAAPFYQWKLNGLDVGANNSTYSNPSLNVSDIITCEVTPDAAGCSVSTILSNTISFYNENPTINSSISISTIPNVSKCDRALTVANFTNMGSNMIANNNNLTKNGPNGWNGGAVSFQSIDDNGEAYTIINETSTNRVFGLTNSGAENSNQSTIDYGIYLVNNGTIRIYESGANRGDFGTYSSGDTIRVVAEDGSIYYYINSNLLYASAIAPVFPLFIDVSINTDGGTLENVYLISGTAGDFMANVINGGASPSYQWKLNSFNVGTNSATYSNPSLNLNDVITCEVTPDATGCSATPILSNIISFYNENPIINASISISTTPTASKCNKALTVATFTSMGSNMSANGNSLTKNGPNGWNGGAVSFQSINDNGEVYTIINETNTNRMFGLTNTGAGNSNYTIIDYAIYLRSNGTIRIYESGTNRGDFGTYSSGDTARVVAEDGSIYYYINNNLLYTSTIPPVFPLYVDVSINTDGATLENVHLISGTAGDFNADVINVGINPSYQWKLNGFNVGTNSSNYANPSLNINDVLTCEVTPDAIGCSVTPILSNTISFYNEDPTINTSISISTIPTANKCEKVLTVAAFTSMGSNMAAYGNDLVKTGSNGWDGGAVSFQSIDDNGEAYTIINETNTNRIFGLTNAGAGNSSFTNIDYGIYLVNNGIIRIYESGTNRGNFGTYSSGDTVRVVAEDGNILYYINSNLLYTSAVTPVFPLYVDVCINTNGATLENIHLISGSIGDFNADVINGGASPSYQWKLNGFNVGTNNATYSNSSLNINDVVTCEVTPDATGCTVSPILSNTITMNNLQLSTQWNGGNTDWFNGSNWSNGIPNINKSATISGAAPTMPNIIGSDANCQGLTIENNASLTITGSLKLSIAGNLINDGTLTTNSSTIEMLNNCDGNPAVIDLNSNQNIYNLIIDNRNGVTLTNGAINLSGTLTLTNGTFSTNNALTLVSDPSSTARIAEITGGSISGDITMQRYIDAGSTNWRFITSPVSNTTLTDFNDDFITSGFTGSDFPNFPSAGNPWVSIYYYDETVPGSQDNGYVPASNITNAVGVGEGLWIWSGDTSTGTQPFTIDVTGPANTGNINLPVSYTNSGNPDGDGWNMVGNPYPSTIDWDNNVAISKTGINNAVYIWNPDLEQFASYVFGLGTNGGSRYIASSQAFWVQATAPGASVQVTEGAKSANDATFLREKSTATPLIINVENNSGTDQAIINFNHKSTVGFDGMYDALKLSSSNANLPSIATLFDSLEFSINQIPEQGVTIPLKITTGVSGMHSISFDGLEQFNDAACVIVEDLFTGKNYDLKKQNSFSCFINSSTKTARFLIKFGATTTTTVTDASCFGSNDGSILIEKEGNNTFDIVWKDENDVVINSKTNVSGVDFLTTLFAGTYTLITTDVTCGNVTSNVTIVEPQQITAQFTSNKDTVYLSNGGSIDFINTSNNANTYVWNFGDGGSDYINNPSYQYTQSGIYNVTLAASLNGNCSELTSKNITILDHATAIENVTNNHNDTKIWINSNNLIIQSQNAVDKVEVRNLLGQLLFSINKKEIYKTIIPLDNIANQTLVVTLLSNNKLYSTKVSFIR